MAMEGVGLGLGVLAEVRTNVKSLQERISCYKQAGELFGKVSNPLSRVTKITETIAAILESSPGAILKEILDPFLGCMDSVKESLERTHSSEIFHESSFSGSCSTGAVRAGMNRFKRFLQAKSLDKKRKDVEKEAGNVEAVLQHQLTQLYIALKTDKMEGNVRGMNDEMQGKVQRLVQGIRYLEICNGQTQGDVRRIGDDIRSLELHNEQIPQGAQVALAGETYPPGTNVPSLPDNLHLDFDTRDQDGRFSAPEGDLRFTLLSSTTSNHVIVATGAERPATVHGAAGMSGVGKTISLVALGHDKAVRDQFRYGVLYMSLGADASVGHILHSLADIMKFTEAKVSAAAMRTELTEAVTDAAHWFRGK